MKAPKRLERGYTVVEILMALAILTTGMLGLMAMQKVSIAANKRAKDLAQATHIAQSWLGVLQADANLWNLESDSSRTLWLTGGLNDPVWFRPSWQPSIGFGPSFDALGNPTENADGAVYCVDLRVNRLTGSDDEAGLARVEVRVIWRRDQAIVPGALAPPAHACSYDPGKVEDANERRMFHFVFMSGAVRQVYRGET